MKLSKLNFQYNGVEYDYNHEYNCDYNGCNDEGICRCGVIVDKSVINVDITSVVKKIYNNIYDDSTSTKRDNSLNQILYGVGEDVNLYIIDRIVRKYKLWQDTNYDIEVRGGYYGQEIGGVYIVENVANKIEEDIYTALSIGNLKDTVEHLLYMEYGEILPHLIDCDYELGNINKRDIIFTSTSHHNIVKKKDLYFYDDNTYNSIRGIVIKAGDKYRLIDGYHRTHRTNKESVKVLIAKK